MAFGGEAGVGVEAVTLDEGGADGIEGGLAGGGSRQVQQAKDGTMSRRLSGSEPIEFLGSGVPIAA